MRFERWWNGSCEETEAHLSEHLDGDLRGPRRWRVLRHLARCELCRAVLASLGRTIDQLRALGRADLAPNAAFAGAVIEQIRRAQGR